MPLTEEEIRKQWGRAIAARREALGMTQTQFAEKVGIAQSNISSIERGATGGKETTRIAIARALGVEVSELYTYPAVAEEAS